ncbi:MAG: RusA family crossover junction endodeoxyribonuclease [Aquificota bacterium]|nr:MAG: RusA family crossover junction endodeoxyribonuclease [Aquificota bacterium]
MIELFLSSLPVPKSNRYVRRKGGKVFKPPRVKNWEVRALWELMNQHSGEPLEGKLSVYVELTLPNHRRRDIDNMLKSLWDILEKARVIKNDSQIYEVHTVKKVVKGVQGTRVKLWRLEDEREHNK